MECIIGSFTYVVIVNLIIIYHIIAQVLLDYTKLRFDFFFARTTLVLIPGSAIVRGRRALQLTASTPSLSPLRLRPFSLLCSGLSIGARQVSNLVTKVSNLSVFSKFVIAICECLCICGDSDAS